MAAVAVSKMSHIPPLEHGAEKPEPVSGENHAQTIM
jgi:hypothetical protein